MKPYKWTEDKEYCFLISGREHAIEILSKLGLELWNWRYDSKTMFCRVVVPKARLI